MIEDFKHAFRIYRRTPGASLVAVAVLAIGLAAVAAFVSLYVDLILRPHPGFERGSHLITFGWNDGRNAGGLPLALIERIDEESATVEAAAGTVPLSFGIGPDNTEVVGELVTPEFFGGVRPRLVLGRGFELSEHQTDAEPVVVISHRYWREALGGKRDVVGTTIEIENRSNFFGPSGGEEADSDRRMDYRIVGVMSPQFTGTLPPSRNLETTFWVPVERIFPMLTGSGDQAAERLEMLRTQYTLRGIGTRKADVNVEAIRNELNARFLEDLPNFSGRPGIRYDVLDGLVFNANVQHNTRRQLQLFLGGSILLALVAAANVSLFLLARAPGRRRELAIRLSVGAPLRRLARQLASEAALLVAVAAGLGLLLSVWLAEYLRNLNILRQAQWRDVTLLDWRVLVIVGAFLAALTLLVSLAPILGLKKLGIAASSRQISARAGIAQRIAGTAQIAIAATVGGAAVAFAWYLGALMLAYPGYAIRDRHAVLYAIPGNPTQPISPDAITADRARLREAIASLPGVSRVSLAAAVPGIRAAVIGMALPNPEDPTEQLQVQGVQIDPHYVDVAGLELLSGRSPSESEPNAILVNQRLAQLAFGRDDVVGENVTLSGQPRQIVGVLRDLSFEHPLADIEPMAFFNASPAISLFRGGGLALIESSQTSAALRQQLQGLVDTGGIEVTIQNVVPLSTPRHDILAPDRARSFLTIGSSTLVVLLAAFGFYGTQRYLVAAGRREYAIRASLGAGPRALGGLVVKRGLTLGLPGLVLGLPFAFIVVAWLRDQYVSRDISPAVVTLAVALGLALLLVVASIGPARRARATQPAPLLRED